MVVVGVMLNGEVLLSVGTSTLIVPGSETPHLQFTELQFAIPLHFLKIMLIEKPSLLGPSLL